MNLGPKLPKGRCERLAHQRVVLHACEDSAALEVYHAGGQDDQRGEGADHDGIRKTSNTPHMP